MKSHTILEICVEKFARLVKLFFVLLKDRMRYKFMERVRKRAKIDQRKVDCAWNLNVVVWRAMCLAGGQSSRRTAINASNKLKTFFHVIKLSVRINNEPTACVVCTRLVF